MSYDHPRDRFELRLKEIVDDTTPAADRRTRFESFLTGIVTSGLTPATARDRLELYLQQLSGRAAGGNVNVDTRIIGGIPLGTSVSLGWEPTKIILSYTWKDPEYVPPGDEDHPVFWETREYVLTGTTDITGEGDVVTFTSTGYTLNFQGTGFNDDPQDYTDFVVTAIGIT